MPKKAQAKLTDEARAFVVQQLAAFQTPAEVAKMVREQFKVTIAPQSIEAYDPTKWAGRSLSKRWRAYFEKARKAYLEDVDSVPESHKAVRVKRLATMAQKVQTAGNVPLAAQLLEQIAKEVGDAYTNRHKHELTGRNGGPIVTRSAQDLTDDELAAIASSGSPGA
jgi:hypothetical protein